MWANMAQSLGRESLQNRHFVDRLCMFFKIQHGLVDVNPDFFRSDDSRTRGSQRLRQLEAGNGVYKDSCNP